ncbi:unnamed protein product [Polarella glacialis]|uniref:Uncharacterized protein n=1 Tax=Polarella glacialis TaxID=89957 RepID=A0A813IB89_POLGL|nr:unnamed protein product [Polarella glacialis]
MSLLSLTSIDLGDEDLDCGPGGNLDAALAAGLGKATGAGKENIKTADKPPTDADADCGQGVNLDEAVAAGMGKARGAGPAWDTNAPRAGQGQTEAQQGRSWFRPWKGSKPKEALETVQVEDFSTGPPRGPSPLDRPLETSFAAMLSPINIGEGLSLERPVRGRVILPSPEVEMLAPGSIPSPSASSIGIAKTVAQDSSSRLKDPVHVAARAFSLEPEPEANATRANILTCESEVSLISMFEAEPRSP